MKIEEYECVKINRHAQARIREETKDLTMNELVAYYRVIQETMLLRQSALGASPNDRPQP